MKLIFSTSISLALIIIFSVQSMHQQHSENVVFLNVQLKEELEKYTSEECGNIVGALGYYLASFRLSKNLLIQKTEVIEQAFQNFPAPNQKVKKLLIALINLDDDKQSIIDRCYDKAMDIYKSKMT